MSNSLSYKRALSPATDEHGGHLEENSNHRGAYTRRHAAADAARRSSKRVATESSLPKSQALSNTTTHPDPSAILGAADHTTASLSKVGPATVSSQLRAQDASTIPHTPSARRSKKRKPAYDENHGSPSSLSTRSLKRLKADPSLDGQRRSASSHEAGSQKGGEEEVESLALRDFDVNSQSGNGTLKVEETKEDLDTSKAKGKQRGSARLEHDEEKRSYDSANTNDKEHASSLNERPGSPCDADSTPGASQNSGEVDQNNTRDFRPAPYSTRAYFHDEVYASKDDGKPIINGYYPSSQGSNSDVSSSQGSGSWEPPKFKQRSDWDSPASQPSLSQRGQDDDSDESQEIDYSSTPPEGSQ